MQAEHNFHDQKTLSQEINSRRKKLDQHPVFSHIRDIHDLRIFMESHVFAVWDFMNLLKRLQSDYSPVAIPWVPPRNSLASRLINDIVLAEESDLGLDQEPISHFELYRNAMTEVDASTSKIDSFVGNINKGIVWTLALKRANVPDYISNFVSYTLNTAENQKSASVAACFFYGRELIIPSMFSNLLDKWSIDENKAPNFIYYLRRHIEVDTEEHGPASDKLMNEIFEKNPKTMNEALVSALQALKMRENLWNGILNDLEQHTV